MNTQDHDKNRLDELTGQIVNAASAVHRELGPGLLESAYEGALACELKGRNIKVERQAVLPVRYKDFELDEGFRLDLMVEDQVIVELKSVREITPLFEAQLLTYLKLSGRKVGFLINFNVVRLLDGLQRKVVGY